MIALLLLAATMCVRPTFLGDSYSYIGCLSVLAVGLLSTRINRIDMRSARKLILSLGSSIVLWLFLLAHSALNGVANYYALSAFVQISACAFGGILCLSNKNVHENYFSYFRLFLAVMSISFLITTLLSGALGLSHLFITRLTTTNYDGISALYFPFTQSYGAKWYSGLYVPRLGAWFRESGIAQAFFACAILSKPELKTFRDWGLLALLVLGGIGAQSTTGLAVIAFAVAMRLIRERSIHPIVKAALVIYAVYISATALNFFLNDTSIGVKSKLETASYIDRHLQMQSGLNAFRVNPLGYGVYSDASPYGINLIASLGSIGVIGALLVISNIVCGVLGSYDRVGKALLMAPLVFTALTSQPLLDAGLVYFFYGFLSFPTLKYNNVRVFPVDYNTKEISA